ncbi:MAG: hypothetical protein DIU56_007470 [Pseudomonadota bacterium]|jgi:hypothetical protein|nr:MAG: hypothetical protein DIU56_02575 [Pseudomonadota bacterium]
MLIRFTRLTNDRHRFEIVRDDGTRESHELETRSTLVHDLAHYAVELEGGLSRSFYGRLARGMKYSELTTVPPEGPEAMQTERVVAMVQGTLKTAAQSRPDPARLFQSVIASFDATGDERPAWLTVDLMARIIDRRRRVYGQWRATPFHETLELKFDVRPSPVA